MLPFPASIHSISHVPSIKIWMLLNNSKLTVIWKEWCITTMACDANAALFVALPLYYCDTTSDSWTPKQNAVEKPTVNKSTCRSWSMQLNERWLAMMLMTVCFTIYNVILWCNVKMYSCEEKGLGRGFLFEQDKVDERVENRERNKCITENFILIIFGAN